MKFGLKVALVCVLGALGNIDSRHASGAASFVRMVVDLETTEYKVGSPIAGYIVLGNQAKEAMTILSAVTPENDGLRLHITSPDGREPVLYWNHPGVNLTRHFGVGPVIQPGCSAKFPLFVVAERGGDVALGTPGRYGITAELQITYSLGSGGQRHSEVLNCERMEVEVAPAAEGYAKYKRWLHDNDVCYGAFARAIPVRAPAPEMVEDMAGYEREVSIAMSYSCAGYTFREWLRTGGQRMAANIRPSVEEEAIRRTILKGAAYSFKGRVGAELWRRAASVFEKVNGERLDIGLNQGKAMLPDDGRIVLDEL